MLRKTWRAAIAVAALALAVGVTVASAAPIDRGQTIRVVERATTDTVVDLGVAGDSIGDTLTLRQRHL
jgi:anti-sigma-K factor RskA